MDPNANTLGIYTEHVRQIGCPHCGAELDVGDFDVFEDIVCPACEKEIKVPGRLGNFILIEELGRGAMGCVYLAQDETLNRLVALKVMRREYGDDPKMLATLQKEAQAMATLNHRNVVQVYSFGREQHQPYFVMELLQGERLDEMMKEGLVDEVRMLEIGMDVAQGLQAAHNAGLTHGDIKPANILMDTAGVGKVVDFGLARFMEPGAEIEVWGTPYYIAPEKAKKKGEDSRSDQYSLGATMFHALAGKPPFDGENPTKVVIASLKEDTPDLKEHRTDVSEKTAAVIRRMMDKNPGRRYPTYASLMADLQLALDTAKAAAEERRQAALREREGQKKKKNTLVPIMAGVAVAIAAAIGVGVYLQIRAQQRVSQITYEGPRRELHRPLTRVEENNFSTAAQALRQNNVDQARTGLNNAARNIPEVHAAKAWYNFFAAGIMIYAQQPEEARRLLEAAANQDPIVFDGGKVPSEDPRLLAQKALGRARERDISRATRNAQPYFRHLLELATGYEYMLQGRNNDAARHFRAYAEIAVPPGLTWPYVLREVAPHMHASRGAMDLLSGAETPPETPTQTETAAGPTATPAPATPPAEVAREPDPPPRSEPAADVDVGDVRTADGFPVFRVGHTGPDKRLVGRPIREASWTGREYGHLIWFGPNDVLLDASGLMLLPETRFLMGGVFHLQANRPEGAPAVLFFAGKPMNEDMIPHGLLVEYFDDVIRVRVGDGLQSFLDERVSGGRVRPGKHQLVTISWAGQASGPNGDGRIRVTIDGQEAGMWMLRQTPPAVAAGEMTASFGRARRLSNGQYHIGDRGAPVLRSFVADRVIAPGVLFEEYRERLANWNS